MNHSIIKTVHQALSEGLVVLEYKLMTNSWIGRDSAGNKWNVDPIRFGDGLKWTSAHCDNKWYRVCNKEDLIKFQISFIPLRNISENR
jgi:hypothetical protein